MKPARIILTALFAGACLASPAFAQDDADDQPAWVGLSDGQRREVLAFAEDYKDFMSRAKTELSFVSEAVRIARGP